MGGPYTGKERMEAAFKGEKLDRTPVFLFLGSHLAEKAGYTLEQTLTDPEAALQTLKVTVETLNSDVAFVPFNPFLPTAQDALRKREGKSPGVKRADIKAKLPRWHVRRADEDPLFVRHLEVCQKTVDMLPNHHIETEIGGPWSFALELRGIMEALEDIYEDKDFLHDLMHYTTETLIIRGLTVSEMGITPHVGDPSAGMSLISPDVYREFVFPYHRRIVRALHANGARVVFHICGYIDPIMADLVSLGIDAISIDALSSLEKMLAAGRGKTTIIGNVDPILFLQGTPAQLENEVKKCMDIVNGDPCYVLAPGCEIPIAAPLVNIRHFIDAGHKYGI